VKDVLSTPSEVEKPKTRQSRGTKRNAEDDEFSPSNDAEDNVDDLNSPETLTKKSNGAGSRKAATRKAPLDAYYINNQLDKPEPLGQPHVWANKRQQLCETLPYYKAYQGGIYRNNGIVYGFLIDKEVGLRDKFDEQIIITTW
jgi:hypothetical protein